ncbi:MAG: hypothetical protein IPH35_08915 [Rhodoferax sp.]|nr:hypothetical protein [Rhodoferax sp.]
MTTIIGSPSDDIMVPTTDGAVYHGLSGNDTYVLRGSLISANAKFTIIDTEGTNKIQLADGLSIKSSLFTATAVKLILSNGAEVKILGADKFAFDIGVGMPNQTYAQLATTLGVSVLPTGSTLTPGTPDYVVPSTAAVTTIIGSPSDDIMVPTTDGGIYCGLNGNDTYVLNGSLISANAKFTIIDTEGTNKIQLADGLSIKSSLFTATAVKLILSNGAEVKILGADKFAFDIGVGMPNQTYAQLATTLGVLVLPTGPTQTPGTPDYVVPGTAVVTPTPPVFASAAVNGNSLVLTYTEASTLDAVNKAPASAFAVLVNGVTDNISAVAVDANAKTVTLTLSTPVTQNQVVTVGYTDPTAGNDSNAIQDAAGNDATTLSAQTVTNNTPVAADTTPPVFASAVVNGNNLVMTYTEASTLDAVNMAPASAFAVLVNGVTDNISAVSVDANAKTVTLTLSTPVTQNQVVTVGYTDPTAGNDSNAIQDAAGNDATTLSAQTVTNNTPVAADTTPPVFASAVVNGNNLVMTYTEASTLDAVNMAPASAFAVLVNGVTDNISAVAVDTNAKTVTLTLSTPVTQNQVVTVGYTDPTAGNDSNAIQDAAGNDATTLSAQTVTNNTPVAADTTPPVFASAVVNGNNLVMTYTEASTLDAVNMAPASAFAVLVNGVTDNISAVAVDANAKTVTLTLSTPVTQNQVVTVSYTDPSAGNDSNAIQDAAGNDATTLSAQTVTNNTPVAADTTPPVFASAVVNGNNLVMTYTEASTLDAVNMAPASAFAVLVNGVTDNISAVAVDANAKTVTLTLTTPVTQNQVVTVGYTDPTAGNDSNAIQDAAGNDATTLSAQTVTNNTVGGGGSISLLTTAVDHLDGTTGNDTFMGTYNGGVATDTFGFGGSDFLNGLGGTDTLNIDHPVDVAITPPDALWANITGIEKIVINTTGNGAQSITTGAGFESAFVAGGVDLVMTTSGSGAINVTMSTFTGAAAVSTTSIAGAQTIVTGSGVATVIATSDAGALTIYGSGLETVTANTTGAGAQTIGDSSGGGEHLVTVTAASNDGAQTITSTSTSAVTVNATATAAPQTVITGTGNDLVTATGAAGQSNTIITNAGNDTIVAGPGTDLIVGGTGTDRMTGGGGTDTFVFGTDGSVIGTSMDVIADFNAAGADILAFGAITALLSTDATALAAGLNVQQSAGGLITFHASDNTLAQKIVAVQADMELDAAGSIAMFIDSGNTYVYYAGTATGNADDQLIQLTGVTSLVTITGGGTTTIA